MEPQEKTRSNGPRSGRDGSAAHTHEARTPRSAASRAAFRSPSTDSSRPTTAWPRSARNTLSRPSPPPRSSTRARDGSRLAISRASDEAPVPKMKRSGVRAYSRPHGLQRSASASLIVLLPEALEEGLQVVGVVLLLGQDLFEQAARRWIVVPQVPNHLGVRLDGNPLGHQILANHRDEPFTLDVFRMAAGCQRLRVHIRLAAELSDPLGEPVRVDLLLIGVLEEFVHDRAGVDARRHVVVPLVAQDAYDLGRQRLVEDAQHRLAVCAVAVGHGTLLHVLTGPPAQLLDVAEERLRLDHEWLLIVLGHGVPPFASTTLLQPRCQARDASEHNSDAAPRPVDAPEQAGITWHFLLAGPIRHHREPIDI